MFFCPPRSVHQFRFFFLCISFRFFSELQVGGNRTRRAHINNVWRQPDVSCTYIFWQLHMYILTVAHITVAFMGPSSNHMWGTRGAGGRGCPGKASGHQLRIMFQPPFHLGVYQPPLGAFIGLSRAALLHAGLAVHPLAVILRPCFRKKAVGIYKQGYVARQVVLLSHYS